jgi:DNA-binding transcriptional MerR regulator
MKSSLTIGEFSRATHLSLKTLRYYHRIGLLEPASVDSSTGYRYYGIEQIPTAQVIRRFRDLGMPVEEVRNILGASVAERARLIASHRQRLEGELARANASLASLEELTKPALDIAVTHRTVPATPALAIREVVRLAELAPWARAAFAEIDLAVGASAAGPAGGLVDDRFFAEETGEITLFVPCSAAIRTTGRVRSVTVPAAELAVVTHRGDHRDIDRSYGAIGGYVARNELQVDGPVREIYLVGSRETSDSTQWLTEIGWPIFRTRSDAP